MIFSPTSSQLDFYTKSSVLDSNIWNQSLIQVFPKIYSYEQLNNAYNCLRRDHESLRIRFKETDNGLVSYVEDYKHMKFPCIKLESDEELLEEAKRFVNSPMDFHGMLVNPKIFHTPTKSGIMISAHHIAVDGFCSYVLSKDINEYLKNPEYRAVTQTYAERIERENKYKQSKRFFSDREFWKKKFTTKPTCNIFSSRNAVYDFSSMELSKDISGELVTKVKSFCKEYEVSPTSFFNTVYAAYLHKMYDVDNFTIGVPVLNRTTRAELNTIGLYMHIVPLIINIQPESFFENIKRINDSWLDILRHQKCTQYDIKQMLREENTPINTLYDIAADFLEFEPSKEYEIIVPYGNNLTVPVELHLQSFSEEKCTLRICYQKSYFTEEEIRIMFDSIISLMKNAVEHPFENINSIEMISAAEKNRLLYEFNNTAADYPRDKCVHQLFEDHAEKTPDKIAVVACDRTLTYKELNEEANKIAHSLIEKGIGRGDIVALMLSRKSYLIASMLAILKVGAAYMPLDPDYPQTRIDYMLSDSGAKACITEKNISELLDNSTISNPNVLVDSSDICYCIYTSGSTGKPKGVLVCHKNVVNLCNDTSINKLQTYISSECSVVLACGSIAFDISSFEIILSLLLNKTLVLANEQEISDADLLADIIRINFIDCVHCTPTKLRTYFCSERFSAVFKNIKCVMVAGEPFTKDLYYTIRSYSNAKIFNGYGPTETTMGVSFGEIDDGIVTIGKPIANTQIYIVDKYMNPVPIGITGELCIAGDCVGAGYLNRPELTAEKFTDNPFGEGKLYKTGDLAYWREDGNLVFVGRNDFQVKVRGLRIELGEIESAISNINGINQSVVVVRKDSEDRQIICAFYTGEKISAMILREEIGKRLPKYMVPHIFTHLEEMPLTSSGKINRKALPEINLENNETSIEYVAPQTEKEIVLTECISEVLNTEKVSVLDNFFDMGGDSLKAIELTAKLESRGYRSEIKTIFASKDIKELAKTLDTAKTEYMKVEYGNVLPATVAQMRVYTSQIMKLDSAHYNIPVAFTVEELDADRLEKAINCLIKRHESLRTHFESREGQIVQIIEDEVKIKVEKLASDDISLFNTPFDLGKSPLIKVGYCGNTVMLVIHHIVADGESMTVLFRELNELYMGRELKKAVQYGEFAVTDGYTEENENYWLNVFSEAISSLELRTDFKRSEKQSFEGSQIYELIDTGVHKRIIEKCKEAGITPYVYYLACLSILISKYSGNEDIVIGTPISGRSGRYLDTVGMFVNTIALRSKPEGKKKIADFLNEIKNDSILAIENQNYPFGQLVKKLGINISGRHPLFDVMLAYQSEESTSIVFGDRKAEILPVPVAGVKCDVNFNIIPKETGIVLMVEYCTELYKEETISQFIRAYFHILNCCLNDNEYIRNISVTDMDIIYSFNNTKHDYNIPSNSTLYSLFEKIAKENKEKICIKTAENELFFGELLEISEHLDAQIREITNGDKSVIAVIAERSVEMYSAIYGIIRGGNAYVPIDPEYPQERIEYILENSGAAAVVAQGEFAEKSGTLPCIDMTVFIKNTQANKIEAPECAATPDDTAYVIYTSGSTGAPKGARVSHRSAVNRIMWMHDKYPLEGNDVILQKTPYTFDVSVWEIFWWGMSGGSLAVSNPGEHFLPAKILKEVAEKKVTHLHFVPSVFDLFLSYLETHREECNKFSSVRYVFLSGESLTAALVERFYKLYDYSKVTLHNLYGPTECAVDVTYYDCVPEDNDPVPIGKPIYNTKMYVVDKHCKPVPVRVTGELCIVGDNVGQGYLNNPKLTAEKFIDNPFGEGKMYKTGDLAYWREDGNIIFAGRIDSQIKLNGQRIELGEIESVISKVNGIVSVSVTVKKANGKDILVAFYTGEELEASYIKQTCCAKLPRYMVPNTFVHLEEIPLNQSGKLDMKALEQIEFEITEESEDDVPKNETEKFICDEFKKILNVKNIGRNSDFFEMGGTSLSMISFLSEGEFANISAAEFMRNPTPAMLSSVIKSKQQINLEYLEPLYISDKAEQTMILLPFAGGGAEAYSMFVNSLKKKDDRISVYFIRYLHSLHESKKAADEIADVLGESEILIYSHCVGAAVALQLISFLERKNIPVKQFFAGAIIPPSKPTGKNLWNKVPDRILKTILVKAGANIKELPDDRVRDLLQHFRKDTDFANISFAEFKDRINAPVSVVLSKKDPFTKNYRQAETLWKKYANNVVNVNYIDSNSHYFQSENAEKLTDIFLS